MQVGQGVTTIFHPSHGEHASAAWLRALEDVIHEGRDVAPRGKPTRELAQYTACFDMRHPLVLCPARKLSPKFAAAEALWILRGDNRVEELARYAPRMREFSDDGVTLAGAYGPEVIKQLAYVVAKLVEDPDTRQAVLTMWKPNPPPSKDIPCTIALAFQIRGGLLNCHAFMRSSDVWLGLPYDAFSFSLIATHVACRVNYARIVAAVEGCALVALGTLYLTAASSHVYVSDFDGAAKCANDGTAPKGRMTPDHLVAAGDWARIEAELTALRDGELASLWERV